MQDILCSKIIEVILKHSRGENLEVLTNKFKSISNSKFCDSLTE
jgi:hypothetical protein